MIVATALLLLISSAVHAQDEAMLDDFAMSPDGRVVAFQFSHAPKGPRGLGLYDWQTGKLTRIPNPPGMLLGVPSFSYDGKRLAVVIRNPTEGVVSEIAVIDLATMAVTQVTHADRAAFRGKTSPVFQPDSDNILYVEGGIGVFSHLRLVNVSNGRERIVLDEKHGFVNSVFRLSFVGSEEIYFSAIAPADLELKNAVERLGAQSANSIIAYRLRFGDKPEILFPELEKNRNGTFGHNEFGSLTASRDGKEVIFIDQTNKGTKGEYSYDLFKLESNGRQVRATNLNSYLAHSRVSYDGSAVAFGVDATRKKRLDLCVLDLRSNQITATDLLRKLAENPAFVSR